MPRIFHSISGRWLAIVGASFAAILVAAHLVSSPLSRFLGSDVVMRADQAARRFAQAHDNPTLSAGMRLVSDMHGTAGILVLAAGCAWVWKRRGHRDACLRLLIAVPGGMLLNFLVKLAFHRVRPDWAIVDLPASYSFPSGHVAEATVFYGSLALEAAASGTGRLRRAAVALGAAAMIALVASSRIVLGVHFLSDCVGAVVEAGLWLAACFSRRPSNAAGADGGA